MILLVVGSVMVWIVYVPILAFWDLFFILDTGMTVILHSIRVNNEASNWIENKTYLKKIPIGKIIKVI